MRTPLLKENSQLITKWQNGQKQQTHTLGIVKNRQGKLVILHTVSQSEIPLQDEKLKHLMDDL